MRLINKTIIQLVDVDSADTLVAKHMAKGMAMVGFHYIVELDGSIEIGRPISSIGNHYIGGNASSIGVAVIGDHITEKQKQAIDTLLEELETKVPDAKEVFIVENEELKKYK